MMGGVYTMRSNWQLDERSKQKYALAEQFGLTDVLKQQGWAGLSAKDSGRIGGCMRRKRSAAKQTDKD